MDRVKLLKSFKPTFLTLFIFRKPVSYYLHLIDRTKLENYFQGLKTKGNGNGDGRTENFPPQIPLN